jgi:predicted nucleic acid-binding protein
MPVLDTAVLFAGADEEDGFHADAVRHLERLGGDTVLAAAALVEFDLVLKSRGRDARDRGGLFALLLATYPQSVRAVHLATPRTFFLASLLSESDGLDYFDALVAAEALEHDGQVVSSDGAFEAIAGLTRIRLK